MRIKIKHVAAAALMAAVICVVTIIIRIPTPMNGYVNLGDCFVLLSGWILDPVCGFLASSIGSLLADLFSGYSLYAPATFLIKGIMTLICALLVKCTSNSSTVLRILSAIIAEIVMVFGYFLYATFILGNGIAALSSVYPNIFQAVFGIVSSVLLFTVFDRIEVLHSFFIDLKKK